MGSEAPTNIRRIFFKDKKNELKGPFTQCQVQEWYKDGWFKDSVFPFYFIKDDSSPDDSTTSFTLDELCSRNGNDTPFGVPYTSTGSELCGLEEGVQALSVESAKKKKNKKNKNKHKHKNAEVNKADGAAAAAAAKTLPPWERMQQPRTKDGAATADAKSAEGAAAAAEEDEATMHEWAEGIAEFFVETCDFFKGDKDVTVVHDGNLFTLMESRVQKLNDDGFILLEELVKRIMEKPYRFCSFCDRFMFTARQTFLHINHPEHISKIRRFSADLHRVNDLLLKMVDIELIETMEDEDAENIISQRERWSSMSLDDPELRPTKRYIVECNMDFHANSIPGRTPYTKAQFAQFIAAKLHTNLARSLSMVEDLRKHIGEAKTCCHPCKLIFANATEYMHHLTTFDHVRQTDPYDNITLAVNVFLAPIHKLRIIPEDL